MFQRKPFVIVALLVALVAGLWIQRGAAAPRQPPAPAPAGVPRWECATLRYDLASGNWVWTSQEDYFRGDKQRLFRDLGGYGRQMDHEITIVDVATQAGLYGWELTTVLDREKGTEMWFKRPIR
jgi:hypothetical protein